MTVSLYRPLLDPVLLKDTGGLARRVGSYVLRVVYVALLAGVLYLFQRSLQSRGEFVSPSEYAALGRGLFTGLVVLQMVFLTIASAAVAADLFLREARSGTLQVLLLAPLSHWRIVFGKWKAAVTQCLGLMLCGTPILAVSVYLGGASPWDLAWTTGLTVALVAFGAAASLYLAVTRQSLTRAIVGVLGLLFVSALPFLVIGTLVSILTRSSGGFVLGAYLHPVLAAFVGFFSARLGEAAGFAWIGAWAVALMFSRWMLFAAAGHLSGAETAGALLAPRTPDPWAVLSRTDAATERRGIWPSFPLLWKEVVTRPAGQVPFGHRLKALLVLCLFAFQARAVDPFVGVLFVATPYLLLLLTHGAALFASERSRRTLEALLSTPLTGARIVAAKLGSALAAPESLCLLALVLIATAWAAKDGVPFADTIAALGVFLAFALTLAGAASLYFRTFRSAFFLSLGVAAALLVIPSSLAGSSLSRMSLASISPVEMIAILIIPPPRFESEVGIAFRNYASLYATATAFLMLGMIVAVRRRACPG